MLQRKQKNDIINGNIPWCSGPKTVKAIVEKFNLQEYVLQLWNAICSCHWSDWASIFNPNYKKKF